MWILLTLASLALLGLGYAAVRAGAAEDALRAKLLLGGRVEDRR